MAFALTSTPAALLASGIVLHAAGEPKGEWAVRQGNWKAHGFKQKCELYELAKDLSETKDPAASNPDKARELFELHAKWLKAMVASENAGNPAGAKPSTDAKPAKLNKEEKAGRREERKKAKQKWRASHLLDQLVS